MSDTQINLKKVRCEVEKHCTSSKYDCNTCIRNKANDYRDKFSMKDGGHSPMDKWVK